MSFLSDECAQICHVVDAAFQGTPDASADLETALLSGIPDKSPVDQCSVVVSEVTF
jgi:hypothetical protein